MIYFLDKYCRSCEDKQNKKFKMKIISKFKEFLNEYQRYKDYGKNMNFGSPEDLKEDVITSVKHLIPMEWDKIPSFIEVTDQSDDEKGIKFEIRLKSGDVIHAFKIGSFRGRWEWYLNRKKMSEYDIRSTLEKSFYSPFDIWKKNYDSRDVYYMMSDDHSIYQRGENHLKYINSLYKDLSPEDKEKADEYMKEKG